MIKNDYIIRLEEKRDYNKTENLVRESFWNVYKPGCDEHFVLKCLRSEPDFIPQLDFVMEKDGQIIGQIVFVKAAITKDGGGVLPVLTFGPICIEKSYQKKGYGKILLDYALEKATEMGFNAVFIEGNINFYRHCGLTYARQFGIRYHGLPQGVDDSFFLAKELVKDCLKDITGEYATPKGYFSAIERADEFAEYESTFLLNDKPAQSV
ncbi:MAG: N-acetyltransferase [Oscillospiraceae bacterium]|nr:N-acetyltransferase [Oscillospiraceae bacterium]